MQVLLVVRVLYLLDFAWWGEMSLVLASILSSVQAVVPRQSTDCFSRLNLGSCGSRGSLERKFIISPADSCFVKMRALKGNAVRCQWEIERGAVEGVLLCMVADRFRVCG